MGGLPNEHAAGRLRYRPLRREPLTFTPRPAVGAGSPRHRLRDTLPMRPQSGTAPQIPDRGGLTTLYRSRLTLDEVNAWCLAPAARCGCARRTTAAPGGEL